MKTKPTPPAPVTTPQNAASEFLGIYVQLANFGAKKPPEPFATVIQQVTQALAPLAAHLLIQDKIASQAPVPAKQD